MQKVLKAGARFVVNPTGPVSHAELVIQLNVVPGAEAGEAVVFTKLDGGEITRFDMDRSMTVARVYDILSASLNMPSIRLNVVLPNHQLLDHRNRQATVHSLLQ